MFQDEIEFLVQETFRIHGEYEEVKENVPEKPGIIYNLQKSSMTFATRMRVSDNIKTDHESISQHRERYPKLRLDGEDKVRWFECDSIDDASLIVNQLNNKRFPVFEENLCNISDPGFSWWLKDEGTSFSVMFNLSHTDQLLDLIKLGPLGDSEKAYKNFQKLYNFFNTLFATKTFSCSRSKMSVSIDMMKKGYFEDLKQALIHGEFSYGLQNFIVRKIMELNPVEREAFEDSFFFLKEIVLMRKFWIHLMREL